GGGATRCRPNERVAVAMQDRRRQAQLFKGRGAVARGGDRTPALEKLRLPATVLHGDSDPLIRPAAGRATAKAIRDSRLRVFEGMGHDLPRALWPEIVEEIAATAARAGERAATPA
ncbi:MAG TPA: hypothetical protein VHF50_02695, partial [Solirubrobacterales bacterium]|nr:hypothetical protein [Solirubrobacterales bacterium]